MAETLTKDDVLDLVNQLENDSGMKALRDDVRRRQEQHAMTDVPWLPDHLTRGITAVMPSSEPAYLAQVLGADMSSYITTTTVIPGKPDLQAKADKVETRYALERAELFPSRVRARMRWSQFIRGYGLYKLVCGDMGTVSKRNKHPWSVILPDPLGTFFTLSGGIRPPMVGRRYEELVRKIETSPAFIDVDEKRRPKRDGDGKWGWQAVSLDVNADDANFLGAGSKGALERCLYYEIDTGITTACVAMNQGGKSGELVWQRSNLTGGTAYTFVPGHITDSREPREAVLPYLWAPMHISNQITLCDTIRMTKSLNVKPQVLIDRNPDLLKAAKELGIARPVTDVDQPLEGDTLLEVDGQPYFWEVPDDKDLDALESRLEVRLARYSSTQLSLTTGEVLKDVTVRGLQLALGARQRQQGPMLSYEDEAEAEILRMWKHSITCDGGYGADAWGLFAKGAELYSKGETKRGQYAEITAEMLRFDHDIDITTASQTREERQLAVDAWAQRKAAGLSTHLEGIDAAAYPDREAQALELTKEEGYIMAGQLAGPNVAARIFQRRMQERAGIYIQGLDQAEPPLEGLPPAGGEQAFKVPTTEGASGGTLPPEVAGGPQE